MCMKITSYVFSVTCRKACKKPTCFVFNPVIIDSMNNIPDIKN